MEEKAHFGLSPMRSSSSKNREYAHDKMNDFISCKRKFFPFFANAFFSLAISSLLQNEGFNYLLCNKQQKNSNKSVKQLTRMRIDRMF